MTQTFKYYVYINVKYSLKLKYAKNIFSLNIGSIKHKTVI